MSWLDIGALVVIALSGLSGFKRGLVVGALSLGGVVIGAILGARIAPAFLGDDQARYLPLAALGGALLLSFVAQAVFAFAGRRLRTLLLAVPPLKLLDHVAGLFLGALTGLALCWAVGAVMLYLPGETGLRETAQESAVLRALTDRLPPDKLMDALSRSDPFAVLAGPIARVDRPSADIVAAAGVVRARNSVVRVRGYACGYGVEGTGWIVGPGLVVTAAHVVAGVHDPVIDRRDGTGGATGRVVAFDKKNDVAVIRAPELRGTPLQLGEPTPNTAGAILGFPGNGPYVARPGRVGDEATFPTRDAYGNFPVIRTVTLIRGVIEQGNSGGPVVSAAGRVLTTVFAARTTGKGTGYGVPNSRVEQLLATAGEAAVDTACAGE